MSARERLLELGPAVAAALDALHAEGAARYGLAGLSPEVFRERAIEALCARLESAGVAPDSPAVLRLMDSLPGPDFVLLIAFRFGAAEEAHPVIQNTLEPILFRAYRRLGVSPEQAESWTLEMLETLMVGAFRKSGSPAFASYEARSPLASWATGVAWNDARRRRSRASALRSLPETDLERDGHAWSLVSATGLATPDLAAVGEIRALLLEALRAAATSGRVPERDLEAFALATLSRREQQVLAARLGVPASTFSRRKERGARVLAEVTRDVLVARLGATEYLRLQVGLDLELGAHSEGVLGAVRQLCREVARRSLRSRPAQDATSGDGA